jgi:hypothetical protein
MKRLGKFNLREELSRRDGEKQAGGAIFKDCFKDIPVNKNQIIMFYGAQCASFWIDSVRCITPKGRLRKVCLLLQMAWIFLILMPVHFIGFERKAPLDFEIWGFTLD